MKRLKITLILFAIVIFSCEKQTTDLTTDTEKIGTMEFRIDMSNAPAEVVKIVGILSRRGFEERSFEFVLQGETATASVESLPAGVWRLKVDAYNNSDMIIYSGSTDVFVVSGTMTPVYLHLNPATGGIYITVTWGEPEREWGEIVNDIRISINLDDNNLHPFDRAYSNILVENVSSDSLAFEAFVSFGLIDTSGVLRYHAFFDLSGTDSSDYFHPTSIISFNQSNLINRTFEITGLPWVSPASSKPPETDFYHLVKSGAYVLSLQIEPVATIFLPSSAVRSNDVAVSVTMAEINKIIYFNSFESAADTSGFSGHGSWNFSREAAPNCGSRSLYVSGGCIWPHVMVDLPAQESAGYYRLEGWGRNLEIGGTVELHNNSLWRDESVSFSVSDSVWMHYASDSLLFCPAGQPMTLMMGAGGIITSAMLVDQIIVTRIKQE